MPGKFLEAMRPISKILPEVAPPKRRVTLTEKIFWTMLVLVVYLVMCQVPLYGIQTPQGTDPFFYMRVIFASTRGSLMEFGIGPIVTAGLILQLLAGAKIIEVDLTNPEDRALFTSASKFLAIIMTAVQASAFLLGGWYGRLSPQVSIIVFLQLFIAGIIVILLDELVQKGWGLGSGISIFIAAGVAQAIMWRCFSPIPMQDGKYLGALIAFAQGLAANEGWAAFRRTGGLPDMIGFTTTMVVLLIIIYLEGVRVEIPISHATYRGFSAKYPVKLLYVSNIPVIFAASLYANISFFSQLLWSRYNSNNSNFWLNLIAQFKTTEEGTQPVGGIVYYMIPPRTIDAIFQDPLRMVVYVALFTLICVVFAKVWVELGGMDPDTVAEQLVSSGMQIHGWRRSKKAIAVILRKYIPTVTVLGGIIVGLIASIADWLGCFGSGMGILLMVDIFYQYYQLLLQERALEAYPSLAKLLGRR